MLNKVRFGEDSYLELKEIRFAGGKVRGPKQDDIADVMAAFANSRGGILLLGIRDGSREVIGIPVNKLDAVEEIVRQACEDSIKPPAIPVIERLSLPDSTGAEKAVIRVDISSSPFVHRSPGGYLHRVGSSKRQIPLDHLSRLIEQRSQLRLIRFDETPIPNASLANLDENLWNRFAPTHTTDAPELLQFKLGMASKDENDVWRPTVAGMLLACRAPEQFLPCAFIQAVAYQGSEISPITESAYQRDAHDITGPLDQQIREACTFVKKNMWIRAVKGEAGTRKDNPQFDMLAIFEAITNAVAHRDYSMAGSKVRVRLFNDRLELYIPGCLVNTMTPESLPFRQAVRNETVTSLLARCPVVSNDLESHRTHIMDKRGEGVPIILTRSEKLSGRTPEYKLVDESELLLTIYSSAVS